MKNNTFLFLFLLFLGVQTVAWTMGEAGEADMMAEGHDASQGEGAGVSGPDSSEGDTEDDGKYDMAEDLEHRDPSGVGISVGSKVPESDYEGTNQATPITKQEDASFGSSSSAVVAGDGELAAEQGKVEAVSAERGNSFPDSDDDDFDTASERTNSGSSFFDGLDGDSDIYGYDFSHLPPPSDKVMNSFSDDSDESTSEPEEDPPIPTDEDDDLIDQAYAQLDEASKKRVDKAVREEVDGIKDEDVESLGQLKYELKNEFELNKKEQEIAWSIIAKEIPDDFNNLKEEEDFQGYQDEGGSVNDVNQNENVNNITLTKKESKKVAQKLIKEVGRASRKNANKKMRKTVRKNALADVMEQVEGANLTPQYRTKVEARIAKAARKNDITMDQIQRVLNQQMVQ